MLFHLANLPYWIFLGMGVLLFLVVIVSGGGDEDFDLDADADVDVDVDVDADVDTDADFGEGGFSALEILGWLGVGKAPLILLLAIDCSLIGVLGWMLNVAIGGVTGSIPEGFLAGVVAALSVVISLFLGGLISRPLGSVFASFGEDVRSDRLIGCTGTVSSAALPLENQNKIGQVDVLDPAGNLVTVSAVLPGWATVIPSRGMPVLIVDLQPHGYLAIAQDSSDKDRWLNNSIETRDSG
jgi:hypothetical protein